MGVARRRRTIPDPARAHGAWVFLSLSTMAGVLSAIGTGVVPALAAGAAFAGIFVASSAAGVRRGPLRARRLVIGAVLVVGGLIAASLGDAPTTWLVFAAAAILPVAAAGALAMHEGFRGTHALAFAVLALTLSAPASACAGGASPADAALLLVLLVPVYVWRSVVTARRISVQTGWSRARLRRQGLVEAGIALVWTVAAVLALHFLRP